MASNGGGNPKLPGRIKNVFDFGVGFHQGSQGEEFKPKDVFKPVQSVGKFFGRMHHTEQQLQIERSRGDMEIHTMNQRSSAPMLTTNHPMPPVFSDEVDKRIKHGAKTLYET